MTEKAAYWAATNRWELLGPELLVFGLALLLLVGELLAPRRFPALAGLLAPLGLLGAGVWAYLAGSAAAPEGLLFGGLVRFDQGLGFFRAFFPVAGALACALAAHYLPRQKLPRVEFYHLVLVATGAAMVLSIAHHFFLLFVALETFTIILYLLVGYHRTRISSLEAALKYLVSGALSSAIMLFGIVLLYGGTAALGRHDDPFAFAAVADFLRTQPDNFLGKVGVLLVLAGVLFKVGAVPFQIWVPDVYQGAPTPVTCFLTTASKGAGVFLLLQLVTGPFAPIAPTIGLVLAPVCVITILFGNFAAFTQRNVKRLLGLSGVSHAGYLLLGVVTICRLPGLTGEAVAAVQFYLAAYLLAAGAVFYGLALFGKTDDATHAVEDYEDYLRSNPLPGAMLVLGLGSLAGVPPLAGFIGKFLLFVAAFRAGLYAELAVAILGVVVSMAYYVGWLVQAASRTVHLPALNDGEPSALAVVSVPMPHAVAMFGLAALSLLLGLYPGLLTW